jgi:hypothetical protein
MSSYVAFVPRLKLRRRRAVLLQEDLDLVSFANVKLPTSELPLKAVHRGPVVGIRYAWLADEVSLR